MEPGTAVVLKRQDYELQKLYHALDKELKDKIENERDLRKQEELTEISKNFGFLVKSIASYKVCKKEEVRKVGNKVQKLKAEDNLKKAENKIKEFKRRLETGNNNTIIRGQLRTFCSNFAENIGLSLDGIIGNGKGM